MTDGDLNKGGEEVPERDDPEGGFIAYVRKDSSGRRSFQVCSDSEALFGERVLFHASTANALRRVLDLAGVSISTVEVPNGGKVISSVRGEVIRTFNQREIAEFMESE